MEKKFDLLSLGEVLLRLSPQGEERLIQGKHFTKEIGGAELNVAAGASMLGIKTGLISVLPSHAIGIYAQNQIQNIGVSTEYLIKDDSDDARLGLYYYEKAASPRKPSVVYDRRNSSFYKLSNLDIPEEIYKNTRCFHTSGITLALDKKVREKTIEMMKRFKKEGAIISFDVNFRGNLWSGEEAKECIENILPYVDVFFCSESTARLTFNKEGDLKQILKSFTEDYPISMVIATNRIVHSPKQHSFGSVAYDKANDTFYEENMYENIEVVDRIGSGDAYISGFLYGLLSDNCSIEKGVLYGDAMSAVKNTIPGDLVFTDLDEINKIIEVHSGDSEDLEMNR